MADDESVVSDGGEGNAELLSEKAENGALEDIINEYEVLFKDRYTENDSAFVESVESVVSVPPLVHPWYNKARRNFDYSRDRSGHRDHHHHHRHEHSSSRHGGGGYREHRSERRYHPYHNDRHRDDRDRHDRHHQY